MVVVVVAGSPFLLLYRCVLRILYVICIYFCVRLGVILVLVCEVDAVHLKFCELFGRLLCFSFWGFDGHCWCCCSGQISLDMAG